MKLDEKFVFELGERGGGSLTATPPKLAVSLLQGEMVYADLAPVFGDMIQGITVDGEPVTYETMYAKLQEYRADPSTIVLTLSGRLIGVEQSHQAA